MQYSVIQTRVAQYLDRSDLSTHIRGWINDTQKDIAIEHDFDYLYMEATCTTSAGTAVYALPSDYLGHLTIMLEDKKLARLSGREKDMLVGIDTDVSTQDPSYLLTTSTAVEGEPDYYVDRGMNIELFPKPSSEFDGQTLTIKYYAQPEDLSADTDETYITRFHFEAVIFGAALRGAIFLDDSAKLQLFAATYNANIQKMIKREKEKVARDNHYRMKSWKDFDLAAFKRMTKVTN